MAGNIYNRRMFRMANGGMMPPTAAGPPMMPPMAAGPPMMPPQGGLPPELAAMMGGGGGQPPPMGGGGGQPPPMDPSQLPPELVQMANAEMQAATNEMMEAEIAAAVGNETAAGIAGVESASDIRELINAVWEDNRSLDEYRADLAAVVGAEDAARTPDSVLALVQPTLQLAAIDQGIGALMQEELGELGNAPGGIAELGAKAAVADGMAAETEALVNAVGGMAAGPVPMMEEEVGMMGAVPGGMAPGPMPTAPGPYV